MTLVTAAWFVSTYFLFRHPSESNFTTWATVTGTVTCAYHWLCIRDDKQQDAQQ